MIQRIQTLYLIVVLILLSFIIFFPFADIIRISDEVHFSLGLRGLFSDQDILTERFPVYPLVILFSLCIAITVFTIFMFKKRMIQIRLSVLNIILILGLQGIMYYYVRFAQTILDGSVSYNLFFIFPLVCSILVFLALRAIARDEALVRSLDRLR